MDKTDNEILAPDLCLLADFMEFPYERIVPQYHIDWSALMQVWYKFRDLDTSAFELLDYSRYKRYWYELANDIPRKPIEHVFKALVEAVKWYNNSIKK
jgi:hypothetical protein